MKKYFLIFTIFLLALTIVNANPIEISNCQELQNIRNDLLLDYVLVNDINCAGFDYGDGGGFMPIGSYSSAPFRGNFDGQGYVIYNLSINRPNVSYLGLFGYVSQNSGLKEIENVGLVDANIIGNSYVGGLVGYLNGGVYNSYLVGEIRGGSYVGGLVGCLYLNSGVVSNSYFMGKVVRNSGSNNYFGGLIGGVFSMVNVYNSYSVAEVSTGGGGLIGYLGYSGVSNSFYDSNVSGKSDVGKGIPKTTSEMKNVSTYLNKWNLVDQWAFIPGDYPKLRWQKDIDFGNAHQPDEKLKIDIVIVADTSGSMSTVWSTLCNKVSEFRNNLANSEYDYRITLYGMAGTGYGKYCADSVTNQYLVGKYGLTGLIGYLVDDWPSNGDMVVQEHDWRENTDARIMFLVGDNDGINQGSNVYTPRCNRLVESALEKNVIVNTLMRVWTANTMGASEIIVGGTGGTAQLYGQTDLLDLVEDIVGNQVQYFPDDLNDVGQCQRGIRRLLPDGNWEILREPVYPSPEDNHFVCNDGIDNDCDGFTDSDDLGCVFKVNNVVFNPDPVMTMQDLSVSFDLNNPNGGDVNCIVLESGFTQTRSGVNPSFDLFLGRFISGSYSFNLFCTNGSLIYQNMYPFDVYSLPDLSIDGIISNSNPDVGDVLEINSEIRNNGGTDFVNVPIEFVYTDLNNDLVDREVQLIDIKKNSSEPIVFYKTISTLGWKILEINVDPENIFEEEYEFNNTAGKLIYGGLFDPSNASAEIKINSFVYPSVRPKSTAGFLFIGEATYKLDGKETNYPVAGAQVDVTIDSNIIGDASPFAELRDWTLSDGNFVIPFDNPWIVADYNALIEVTDGTAYGFSIENFSVDENSIFVDHNTPWGNWDSNGNFDNDGGSGSGGGWGGGSGGGGGWGSGPSCDGPNLYASIIVDYPNIDFYVGGSDASNPDKSIQDKSYNIVIVLNGSSISLSRTGVINETVYSGVINEGLLPQTASIYVDYGNSIIECVESDNYRSVDLKGPNIKAESILAVSSNRKLLQGEVTTFTLVMENTGSRILYNVPVTFTIDGNLIRSYVINSIGPNQRHRYVFQDILNGYGLSRFTLSTSFVDSDMSDNSFSKLFKVLIPDYYARSFEDGKLIIVNPEYPFIGQSVDINAIVKSNDRVSRDALVPVELFADGLVVGSSSVLFPNGKNFAFAFFEDYVIPSVEKTVSMGIYVNRALRHFEENSMNNYVTFPLFVSENPLLDANVLLLKVIDDKLNFVVEKSLNTKFSSSSDILPQIIDYINNSIDLKVDSLDKSDSIFRVRVDVNNEQYFSNYFLVKEHNCGDAIVVPTCENGFEPTPGFDEFNCPILICTPIVIESCWSEDVTPHPICSLEDLNRVREHLDWSYVLKNDINAYDTRTWDDGKGWNPIGNVYENQFRGKFNGNGFVIYDLYIHSRDSTNNGLFGHNSGEISNIGLENVDIYAFSGAGAIAHSSYSSGIISNSYSTGKINTGSAYVGGIVGFNLGIISNCYSLVNVTAADSVGGLVGMSGGNILNSYSTGRVTGTYVLNTIGGLVGGENGIVNVINSYWDIQTSDQLTSFGGTGKLTSEMFTPSTFVDWNNNVWSIVQGEYPKLKWQVKEKSVSSDSELNAGPVKRV